MREIDGVPVHPSAGTETGVRSGSRAPHRRRTLVVAMLAAVAAAGALTAVAGPALAMRPVSSTAGSRGGAAAKPSGPSATAAALALELASATATTGDATTTAKVTAAPAATGQGGQGTTGPARPMPMPMPCNAAGTSPSSGAAVRPCPPPPCYDSSASSPSTPSGAMAPNPCPPPPCNAASTNPWGPSPMVVRPCPQPPSTVMLTEKDSGRTITVHPGTRIEVRLAGSGPMTWTVPRSSDGTIIIQSGGGQDGKGDADGSFRAAQAGKSDLSATQNPNCRPQCMMPSRLWVMHIVVA